MTRSVSLLALCVLGIAAFGARAGAVLHSPRQPDVVSTELGIETSSDLILLPTSEVGDITVNRCAQCKTVSYSVTRATQYFVGSERVSLFDLHRYLVPGESRFTMIYVSPSQRVVERVVVSGSLAGARKAH
jgi:hypothetical protein